MTEAIETRFPEADAELCKSAGNRGELKRRASDRGLEDLFALLQCVRRVAGKRRRLSLTNSALAVDQLEPRAASLGP